MFVKSKNYLNGGGTRASFSRTWSRNGNGYYFGEKGYEEEEENEMFNNYNGQIGESSFVVDTKVVSAIVIVTAVGVAFYKGLQLSMEEVYIDWAIYTFDSIYDATKHMLDLIIYCIQTQVTYIWELITDQEAQNLLKPFICGLIVSWFSWMMVYMDSQAPGLNPPSPFSSNSRDRFRDQKLTSTNIGYVVAVASGVVVTGLMLCQKNDPLANIVY